MTNEPLKATHTPLPCPFCGGAARYKPGGGWQYYDTWAVECVGCGAQINGSTDMRVSGASAKAEALTAWNTRAVNSHHDLIEALRALAKEFRTRCRSFDNKVLAEAEAILTKEAGHG